MQYKGREKSKNIQDRRYSPKAYWKTTVEDIIQASDEIRNGKSAGGNRGSRAKATGSRTGGGF